MLDFAEAVAINKFDRRGAQDALRDVRRQLAASGDPERVPRGATGLRDGGGPVQRRGRHRALPVPAGSAGRARWPRAGVLPAGDHHRLAQGRGIVPADRERYLADVADGQELPRGTPTAEAARARRRQQLGRRASSTRPRPASDVCRAWPRSGPAEVDAADRVSTSSPARRMGAPGRPGAPTTGGHGAAALAGSPSGTRIPRVALPRMSDEGDLLRWLRSEHLPVGFRIPPGCSPSSGTTRTRPGCSPAKATRSARTGASTCWPRASPPPACRRRSTR